MKYMTNNLATDEKPAAHHALALFFYQPSVASILEVNMVWLALLAVVMIIIAVVQMGDLLITEWQIENGVEEYTEVPKDFEKEAR